MCRHILEATLIALLTAFPASGAESSHKLVGEAFSLFAKGDAAAALPKLEEALELSEKTGDRPSRALGLFLRGISTVRQRGPDAAQKDFTESLDIFDEAGDHFGSWMVRLCQAAVFQNTGQSDKALEAMRATLEWLGETERSGSAGSFDTLKVLMATNPQFPPDMARLLDQMDAFLPMMQPILSRTFRTTTLLWLSKLLRERKEYEDALPIIEEARELSEHLAGLDVQVLQEQALVKRALGREEEAAADEEVAQEMSNAKGSSPFDPRLQEGVMSLIMDGLAKGNQEGEALETLEDRLARARETDDVRSEAVLLGLLAREYHHRKRQEESSFYYERSLETAWHLRSHSEEFGEDAPGADVFTALDKEAEADEILGAASHASSQDVFDALLLLAARGGQTELAFDYAERARAEASEGGSALPLLAEPFSIEELRSEALDDDTSLLAYYVAGPNILAWVADRDRTEAAVLDLPDGDLFARARALAPVGSQDFDLETASALHRALIAPVAPWIRHRHLLVVAQGVLRDLPFESFRDSESGRFLAEQHEVTRIAGVDALRSSGTSAP